MRGAIRHIHSPDCPGGELASFPPTSATFRRLVEVDVGPDDGVGAETFGVIVRSPDAPGVTGAAKPRWTGREMILDRWDAVVVERALRARVESTEGSNWQEIADQLRPSFYWEFEDYRP